MIAPFLPFPFGHWERRLVVFGGTNQRIIGSHEGRKTRGIGLAFERTDRTLSRPGWRGSFLFEGSYVRSLPDRVDLFEVGGIEGFQVLGGVRFSPAGSLLYLEALSGFFVVFRTTRDLSSAFNFSPTLGIGARLGRVDLGVRFSHISNADTHLPNNGLNIISFVAGYRF